MRSSNRKWARLVVLAPLLATITMLHGCDRDGPPARGKEKVVLDGHVRQVVRSREGRYARSVQVTTACPNGVCARQVVRKRDGKVLAVNDRWVEDYVPTGRGLEVVLVEAAAPKARAAQ